MSLSQDAVRLYWLIECEECGESDDVPKEFCEDATLAARHFEEFGWRNRLNAVMCAACALTNTRE